MVKGANFVKTYLVSLGLFGCLIVLFVSGAFYYNLNELIHDRLLHRSRAFFQEILLTRQWIAGHNGVYVKLGPGTVVNPYLLQVSGLKVVITDANEDDISHNIFYTAITRARQHLKIFWTPETENAVLTGLRRSVNRKDAALLSSRRGLSPMP